MSKRVSQPEIEKPIKNIIAMILIISFILICILSASYLVNSDNPVILEEKTDLDDYHSPNSVYHIDDFNSDEQEFIKSIAEGDSIDKSKFDTSDNSPAAQHMIEQKANDVGIENVDSETDMVIIESHYTNQSEKLLAYIALAFSIVFSFYFVASYIIVQRKKSHKILFLSYVLFILYITYANWGAI